MGKLPSVIAWGWTAFVGIGSIGLVAQGHVAAAGLSLVSAAAACPPIWRVLAGLGIGVPIFVRWIAGGAAIIGAAALMPQTERLSEPGRTGTADANPSASMWVDFDEPTAVVLCDQMVAATAVNRGSVKTAWRWTVSKNGTDGRATIERDFEAKNALGGEISSRYRCVVDRTGRQIIDLSVRELGGWRKVM